MLLLQKQVPNRQGNPQSNQVTLMAQDESAVHYNPSVSQLAAEIEPGTNRLAAQHATTEQTAPLE